MDDINCKDFQGCFAPGQKLVTFSMRHFQKFIDHFIADILIGLPTLDKRLYLVEIGIREAFF